MTTTKDPVADAGGQQEQRHADFGPSPWCYAHNRSATAIDKSGQRCCDPNLGGIMIPCRVDAGGPSEAQASDRPGFAKFIRHDDDYEGASAFGFQFSDHGHETERYAMVYRVGMGPLEFAMALEKIAQQMRTRTGANGQERLAGSEVNAADFARLPNPASEKAVDWPPQEGA